MSRKYATPPVVEALCEVSFLGGRWDSTVPGAFFERVRSRYPHKEDHVRSPVDFLVEGAAATTRVHPPQQIVRFCSEDRSRIVQVGRDLLVVNQLRPYPHFEQWCPVVAEMMGHYEELVQPGAIGKLVLRYLNHVEVPDAGPDLASWFRLYPQVPDEIGRTESFMLRLEIRPQLPGHRLVLTLGSAETTSPATRGVLLDLYDEVTGTQPSMRDVPRLLDEAHRNIEAAFENTITDQLRRVFN